MQGRVLSQARLCLAERENISQQPAFHLYDSARDLARTVDIHTAIAP